MVQSTARPPTKRQLILGWLALLISTVISGCWAFWGTCEAFHEGWWSATLAGRLGQTAVYHIPLMIVLGLCCLSIAWPKLGGSAYFLLGSAFTILIFRERWGHLDLAIVLSWLPVTGMVVGVGLLWWFGRPRPLKWAFWLALGVPVLISLCCAVEPIWRLSHRSLTAELGMQVVSGNGVALTWAPAGPGWVRDAKHACRWAEAAERCDRLSADGTTLEDAPQHIWRLPTVDECARSATRQGKNAGGVWDAARKRTTYKVRPDKEAPLWDPLAETIYWWTATETDADHAYFYVYHGGVYACPKTSGLGSRGFRAVKGE